MKFHELAVGEKFKFNNEEYVKTKEVKSNCCRVKENCQVASTGQKAVIKPLDEVERIQG